MVVLVVVLRDVVLVTPDAVVDKMVVLLDRVLDSVLVVVVVLVLLTTTPRKNQYVLLTSTFGYFHYLGLL